ncbi:membrane-associated progesterone-binding protein 4 [Echria macrotheca]|uniref:Membrane-associated progesterone-binding protein 4 n=1 Tax=Echria macrotheca TaxID=438768 RepID=A0AAJ0F5D3_9PEZI|nr:membrane-associated progesterone-binding protein 4 [Echria macrotheca]
MSDAVRRRKLEKSPKTKKASATNEPEPVDSEGEIVEPVIAKKLLDDEDAYSPWIDVLRVITFLFVASCGLSYLISGGESFFWGMKHTPNYLKSTWWKAKLGAPLYLTLEELSAFDGTDPEKPIYLAINGTIYDVSSNARTYGPGGSYHYFAGCDASRGYVTGCFAEDRTADMRGVEEMFLPIDDPSVDRHWSKADLEKLKAEELATAKQKVYDGLKHWVDFFARSKKYHFVGYVKRPKGWPGTEPVRRLCDAAQKNRMKRQIPGQG